MPVVVGNRQDFKLGNPPSDSLSHVIIGLDCRGNNKDKLDQDFSRKILAGLSRLRSDDNFCDIELFSTEGRGRRTPETPTYKRNVELL